ncbi:MAG: L,D-transpeptidase family protein [Ruminococcus sp.]|nr:L,D-transpeptidase family protein [Ruminococcus sp.]
MKKTKRFLAILLSTMIAVSAVSAVSYSAAETGDDVSAEPTTVSVTQAPTEAPTQAATEAVTQAPTQPATAAPTTEPEPVVGKIKTVEKTSFEPDCITLKWDAVANATGYYVYVCNRDSSDSFKKILNVKTNTATINNLEHTTQYWFKVIPYITKDGKTYEGEATMKKTATQAGTVQGLDMVRSSSVIQFDWNRNPKATGYKIYRACSKTDAEYVLYKTITDNKVTSFSDTDIEDGRAYYYSVRPYRILYGDAIYHAYHKTIKFICGMCSPSSDVSSHVSRANLTWKHNRWATGYDIYYSTDRYKNFKYLDSTEENFFNTVRLTPGTKYYFRIQPYKINGASRTKVVGTWSVEQQTITTGAFGKSVGGTYVEISIDQQYMWLYVDRKLIVETDVVTGNDDGYCNTPRGAFNINSRARNTYLNGAGYSSFVNYWMGFYGGCGIHDASWRSSYGGHIYQGNGSHGCVNTPYSKVQKIYNWTEYGTPVIVY